MHPSLHEEAASQAARILGGLVTVCRNNSLPEAGQGRLLWMMYLPVDEPERASVRLSQPSAHVSEESHDVFMPLSRGQGDRRRSCIL